MSKRIIAAVRAQREVIEGVGQQDALTELIAGYARRSLYTAPDITSERLHQAIAKRLARQYLPAAHRAGMDSAAAILDGIGGGDLARKGSALRGEALAGFKRYHRSNLAVLEAELNKEALGLAAEIKAGFARAERDGIARRQWIEDSLACDRAELERLALVRRDEIRPAARALAAAEAGGNERQIAEDRRALQAAKAKVRTSRSLLARFETKAQGRARDAVRRECQQAQFAAFRQAGYAGGTFVWVAVNGGDACPQCTALHGRAGAEQEWRGRMPGDGQTYCGSACECQLVPEEFTRGRESLREPITVLSEEGPAAAGRGPRLQRMADYADANSVSEARAWAYNHGVKRVDYADRLDIANVVNRSIAEATKRGMPVPDAIVVDRDRFGGLLQEVAHFDGGTVFLNPQADFWGDPSNAALSAWRHGRWSTADPLHACLHELAHHERWLSSPRTYGELQRMGDFSESDYRTAVRVSVYAGESHLEFLAETRVGLLAGTRYNSDVMRLYRRLGGAL